MAYEHQRSGCNEGAQAQPSTQNDCSKSMFYDLPLDIAQSLLDGISSLPEKAFRRG